MGENGGKARRFAQNDRPIRFGSKVGVNNGGIDRKIFGKNGKRFVYFRNARFIATTRRPLFLSYLFIKEMRVRVSY